MLAHEMSNRCNTCGVQHSSEAHTKRKEDENDGLVVEVSTDQHACNEKSAEKLSVPKDGATREFVGNDSRDGTSEDQWNRSGQDTLDQKGCRWATGGFKKYKLRNKH